MTATDAPPSILRPDLPSVHTVTRNVHPDTTFRMDENPDAVYFGWDSVLNGSGDSSVERRRNLRDALVKATELVDATLPAGERLEVVPSCG